MSTTTHDDGDTLTRPAPRLQEPGDHDRFAHYTPKEQIEAAILSGAEATALCGHRWVPRRDPQRFPVCPRCKELWGAKAPGEGQEADR